MREFSGHWCLNQWRGYVQMPSCRILPIQIHPTDGRTTCKRKTNQRRPPLSRDKQKHFEWMWIERGTPKWALWESLQSHPETGAVQNKDNPDPFCFKWTIIRLRLYSSCGQQSCTCILVGRHVEQNEEHCSPMPLSCGE